VPKKSYKQILGELKATYAEHQGNEEKKSALDDRLGLQKLHMADLAEQATDLGHPLTEVADDAGIRYALLDRWVTAHLNWPDHKRPKDVIVSFSVLEELDGPDRFTQMAELVKMAKARVAGTKKPARVIVNDIRELQGKKLTRYAPPPRTPDEKLATMQEWMNEPEIATRAANDMGTRMAFNRAIGDRHREIVEHTKRNERSNWGDLRDAGGAWDAHNDLEKATAFAQKAYDQYADLGQLPDEERARARALLSRLQLVASYLESLIEGGQPLEKALADLLGGDA
jgi:hypothetical protein